MLHSLVSRQADVFTFELGDIFHQHSPARVHIINFSISMSLERRLLMVAAKHSGILAYWHKGVLWESTASCSHPLVHCFLSTGRRVLENNMALGCSHALVDNGG